jgi:GTPase SAR1 family protein
VYKCILLPKGGSIHFNIILRNSGIVVENPFTIMLVGTGECGKTTFFKQNQLQNESYNVAHANIVLIVILSCTIKCFTAIRLNPKALSFENPKNSHFMEFLLEMSRAEITNGSEAQYLKVIHIPLVFSAIVSIWREPVMLRVLNKIKLNHFCNPELFFKNLQRISIKQDFSPYMEDLKILMKSSIEIALKQKVKFSNLQIQALLDEIGKKKRSIDTNTLFSILSEPEVAAIVKTNWDLFPKTLHKMSIVSKLIFIYYNDLKPTSSMQVPEFEATKDDILMISSKTTGIVLDTPCVFNGKDIRLVDTGGQQSERHKWIKFIKRQNPQCIVYLIDLSSYNERCYESNDNRMLDDLKALSNVCESIEKTKIILFFNKLDLFLKKIRQADLVIFPEYKGGKDSENALNFILSTYTNVLKEHKISDYHEFVGSALNWQDIHAILDLATQKIISTSKSPKRTSPRLLSDISMLEVDETEISDLSKQIRQLDTVQSTDVSIRDHPDLVKMMKRRDDSQIHFDATDADVVSQTIGTLDGDTDDEEEFVIMRK